ncbi:MAG: hypothetical protein FH762_05410 [Firmicutes bacterium]|nr:hypothetical protein [Bacillota bacterium]
MEERGNEYRYDEYEIDLREYILLLWNKKWLILTITITALLLAGIYTFYIAVPTYQTEASLILSSLNNTQALINLEVNGVDYLKDRKANLSNNKYSDAELATEYLIGNEFIDKSKINLKGNKLKVEQSRGTNIIKLALSGNDPEVIYQDLTEIVNVFKEEAAQYYKQVIGSKQDYLDEVNNEIDTYNDRITKTNNNLNTLLTNTNKGTERLILQTGLSDQLTRYLQLRKDLREKKYKLEQELMASRPVEIIDKAVVPTSAIKPKKKLNMAIAGVLGLMIAFFMVFFVEFVREEK